VQCCQPLQIILLPHILAGCIPAPLLPAAVSGPFPGEIIATIKRTKCP